MKKLLSFMIALLMAASAQSKQSFPMTTGGGGTESSPYLISTPEELKALSSDVNAGITYEGVYFKLFSDIDFKDVAEGQNGNFICIDGFKGIFDGDGKRLKNIKNKEGDSGGKHYYAGIFEKIENAVVKNVIIDESCSFTTGSFISSAINSTVTGCINYGTVKGSCIVQYCKESLVSNCINYGVFMGAGSGFYGGDYCGGIVGYADTKSTISKCKNYGSPSGDNAIFFGGIVGYSYGSDIEDCENYADFEGYLSSVGGIVGMNQVWDSWDPQYEGYGSASIKRCKNYGNINVSGPAAGIVYCNEGSWHPDGKGGYFQVACEISDCINEGDVELTEGMAAGIVCNNSFADILRCNNKGSVKSTVSHVGGIVAKSFGGAAEDGTLIWARIKDCTNEGDVTVSSTTSKNAYAGGIVGNASYNTTQTSDCSHEIVNCKNSGNVTGYHYAGGIVGENDSYISDCFNSGNVTAMKYEYSPGAGAITGSIYDARYKDNYYDSKVIVISDGKVFSGAMSRGTYNYYDAPVNNGAMMKSITIDAKPQGDEYWTTFQKNYGNYQADEKTTVYTAQRVLREQNDGPQVYRFLLTEVPNRIIKGGEDGYLGVILRSTQSQITLTLTAEEPSEAAYSVNTLGGCDHPIKSDNDDFVLTTGEKFGFIKCVESELPANSAYTSSSLSSYWPDLVELELNGKVLYHIEPGDLNRDDIANLSDLRLMVNAIMTGSNDGINEKAADMNNDTKVNAADVVLMVKKVNKLVQKEETGYYLIGEHNNWSMTDKTYAFSYNRRKKYWEITVSSKGMSFFKIVPESAYADQDTFWSNLLCAETDWCTSPKGTIVKGDYGAWLLNAEGATSYTIRIVPSEVSYEIIAH